MGDHTESLQVDFDPEQIAFEEIADLFWKTHNPCGTPYSQQYMTAIWYHDDVQRAVLEARKESLQQRFEGAVTTPVQSLGKFYLAENYHQKYGLQSKRSLMERFNEMYPRFEDFNNSTAAARLNGLAYGGSALRIQDELDRYGFELMELKKVLRL